MKREHTLIDGHPVWFAVCCNSECDSNYLGPFFSEEDAQEEANITSCDNTHFLATYVPEFAIVYSLMSADDSRIKEGIDYHTVKDWIDNHNYKAEQHPIYEMSKRNVDFSREHPLINEA